ncbi:aldehyde dehydrogenase [Paenisporosarcina cavernae]|uniref:Aldehyde dehydrogenase n=1 Tax=Paenisporosarcina cavernae TaxID=2320858 RepID=A0A385YV22_9BACL|nr:aldehyde dehydrogenase [Paenisporosarcina cavernae]AYC30130.1 aldehyde dehydrogenase [Paenisporosarcina cavernae]
MLFTASDVENMITKQKNYFYTGATKSVEFRKASLLKLRVSIQNHEEAILDALHQDLGKSGFESYGTEIGIVYDSISYMLKNVEEWMKPESVSTPITLMPAKSFIIREPYGSVLIIGPFNYPFQLVMEPLLGAIVGGNCAIVKPSESTPTVVKVIRSIIESTFEPHYIQVVEGERDETSALIHAPFDYIFFTGSVGVGKIVMRAASERLTPITLELGGKSPAVVDHTAKLAVAADRIVWGKFVNAGQTCVAPDYVLVHRSVKEKFIKELKRAIHEFYGSDVQQSPDYGRIVNEKQLKRLKEIIELESYGRVYGGKVDEADLYIEPTIIEEASWSGAAMEDEIFGPILPILVFDHLPEAIDKIRKLPKPLAAYFFSENDGAISYFLDELSFGGGCINDTLTHVGNTRLPFGGVGQSGMNAYHGKYSFETFTHAKSIVQKGTKFPLKVLFPPYGNKLGLIRKVMK